MNRTYFIADIAANHDGSLERAKKLCRLAKQAGADAAKFQHFKAQTIVSDKGFKDLNSQSSHQSKWEKSVFEVYEDASVPLDWTPELKKYCDEIGIDFFTTPYDLEYVDYLDDFVGQYKIGSGDITWHKMLHKVASKGKPVMIATGASTKQEVIEAMDLLTKYDIEICLMQCNTNYTVDPKNFKYINLNVLRNYRESWPDVVLGLSDHTPGDVTVLGAVTMGAAVIEKHFTDDNNRVGPDHPFSMNPLSWKNMVERTRVLENALGDGRKIVEKNESTTVVLQRRSIRVDKNLTKGHILTGEDLTEVRPCPPDAIPPSINLIGKSLTRDIKENDYLTYKHIE